jgi:four helix bundle protein
MKAQSEELRDRTKAFALRIVRFFKALSRTPEAQIMGKQVLRSGTSVAGLLTEARELTASHDTARRR